MPEEKARGQIQRQRLVYLQNRRNGSLFQNLFRRTDDIRQLDKTRREGYRFLRQRNVSGQCAAVFAVEGRQRVLEQSDNRNVRLEQRQLVPPFYLRKILRRAAEKKAAEHGFKNSYDNAVARKFV